MPEIIPIILLILILLVFAGWYAYQKKFSEIKEFFSEIKKSLTAMGQRYSMHKLQIVALLFGLLALHALINLIMFLLRGKDQLIFPANALPDALRNWDVFLFVMLECLQIATWVETKVPVEPPSEKSGGAAPGRNLKLILDPATSNDDNFKLNFYTSAANSLKDSSSAYITAVSILIPACFVIVQVAKQPVTPPNEPPPGIDSALPYVFRAVIWFLGSLLFGMTVLYIVSMYGRRDDVTTYLLSGIPFNTQCIALLTGVLCLTVGLYFLVFPK